MAYPCDQCTLRLDSATKLSNHKYDAHTNLVEVYFDNRTVLVARKNGKFKCTECTSTFSTPTTFNRHLNKKHDGECSSASKKQKRSYSEVDSSYDYDDESDDDDESEEDGNGDDSEDNRSESDIENCLSIQLVERQLRLSPLSVSEPNTSSLVTARPSPCDRDMSILLASSSLSLSSSEQQKCIMLAKVGDWEPITLSSTDGKSYHFLTSAQNIQSVLVDKPSGEWILPTTTYEGEEENTQMNDNHLFNHIVKNSPFSKYIDTHNYTELSEAVMESINMDWILFPQLRHVVSQLFSGSILVEKGSAVLLNCIEPYGRLKSTDAHYERRLSTTMQQSSFPKTQTKYGFLAIVQVNDDNVMKLKIGTTTFNLLVTSSMRLDNISHISDIVEMGAKTSHFAPTSGTRVYLDNHSITLVIQLTLSSSINLFAKDNMIYQLRQIRSKFHCLSTYTLCRNFSSLTYDIIFRPFTIWTLYEYDSPQKIDSQARLLSSLFQKIAYAVIKDGSNATIEVNCFKAVQNQLKDNAVNQTLSKIIELGKDGSITIIDNIMLSSLLQSLADTMITSIKTANNNTAKLLQNHLM